MKKKIAVLILCVAGFFSSDAQDTTALIKEFNKVMSFAVQPYLYYKTYTVMEANPVMRKEDTTSTTGEFYKNEENFYYTNSNEEVFCVDSLFIRIDNSKKSIWISKMDVSTKAKMNMLPLKDKDLQKLFRNRFVISKERINGKSNSLQFESKQYVDSIAGVTTNIGLKYSGKSFLPEQLEMLVNMTQKTNDAMLIQMQNEGVDTAGLVRSVNNNRYVFRSQRVMVNFDAIDNTKEKAMQMPSWEEKVGYDLVRNEYAGKGRYSEYEVIKTF